jgi:hypothetical protein
MDSASIRSSSAMPNDETPLRRTSNGGNNGSISSRQVSPLEELPVGREGGTGARWIASVSPASDNGSELLAESNGRTNDVISGTPVGGASPRANGGFPMGNGVDTPFNSIDLDSEFEDDPRILELVRRGFPIPKKLPEDINEFFRFFHIQTDIDQISIYHPNPCRIIEAMQYDANWVIPRVIRRTGTMNSSRLRIAFPPDMSVGQDGRRKRTLPLHSLKNVYLGKCLSHGLQFTMRIVFLNTSWVTDNNYPLKEVVAYYRYALNKTRNLVISRLDNTQKEVETQLKMIPKFLLLPEGRHPHDRFDEATINTSLGSAAAYTFFRVLFEFFERDSSDMRQTHINRKIAALFRYQSVTILSVSGNKNMNQLFTLDHRNYRLLCSRDYTPYIYDSDDETHPDGSDNQGPVEVHNGSELREGEVWLKDPQDETGVRFTHDNGAVQEDEEVVQTAGDAGQLAIHEEEGSRITSVVDGDDSQGEESTSVQEERMWSNFWDTLHWEAQKEILKLIPGLHPSNPSGSVDLDVYCDFAASIVPEKWPYRRSVISNVPEDCTISTGSDLTEVRSDCSDVDVADESSNPRNDPCKRRRLDPREGSSSTEDEASSLDESHSSDSTYGESHQSSDDDCDSPSGESYDDECSEVVPSQVQDNPSSVDLQTDGGMTVRFVDLPCSSSHNSGHDETAVDGFSNDSSSNASGETSGHPPVPDLLLPVMGVYVREITRKITNNHNPSVKPMLFFNDDESTELSSFPTHPVDGWIPIQPESMVSDVLEDEPVEMPQSRPVPRSFSGPGRSVEVISSIDPLTNDDVDISLRDYIPDATVDDAEQYEDIRDVCRQLRSGRPHAYPILYTSVFGNSHTGNPTACRHKFPQDGNRADTFRLLHAQDGELLGCQVYSDRHHILQGMKHLKRWDKLPLLPLHISSVLQSETNTPFSKEYSLARLKDLQPYLKEVLKYPNRVKKGSPLGIRVELFVKYGSSMKLPMGMNIRSGARICNRQKLSEWVASNQKLSVVPILKIINNIIESHSNHQEVDFSGFTPEDKMGIMASSETVAIVHSHCPFRTPVFSGSWTEVKASGHIMIPERYRRAASDSARETALLRHGYDPALLQLPDYGSTTDGPIMNMNDSQSILHNIKFVGIEPSIPPATKCLLMAQLRNLKGKVHEPLWYEYGKLNILGLVHMFIVIGEFFRILCKLSIYVYIF